MALTPKEVEEILYDFYDGEYTIPYRGTKIQISIPYNVPDPLLEQGIEDGFIGAVLAHKHYNFPSSIDIDFNRFDSWDDIFSYIDKEYGILDYDFVYLTDHSGLWISYGYSGSYSDWDSGVLGFIFYTKEHVRKFTGYKKVTQKALDKYKPFYNHIKKVFKAYVEGHTFVILHPIEDSYYLAYGEEIYDVISDITKDIDTYYNEKQTKYINTVKEIRSKIVRSNIKHKIPLQVRERIIMNLKINILEKVFGDLIDSKLRNKLLKEI